MLIIYINTCTRGNSKINVSSECPVRYRGMALLFYYHYTFFSGKTVALYKLCI